MGNPAFRVLVGIKGNFKESPAMLWRFKPCLVTDLVVSKCLIKIWFDTFFKTLVPPYFRKGFPDDLFFNQVVGCSKGIVDCFIGIIPVN